MHGFLVLTCLLPGLTPAPAAITGQYVEARTCDVWTGPCFANSEMNLGGKHAVIGWKIDKGVMNNVRLDGLAIVAVVAASDTLGQTQTAPGKALLIVDERASPAQRDALVKLAHKQGGSLLDHVVQVASAKVNVEVSQCKEGGCARLDAGKAKIETRCLDSHHDKVCGNESAFYPPLTKGAKATPAVATELSYTGKAFNATWSETDRRGAYVGFFEAN